jgi:hypothetical protein
MATETFERGNSGDVVCECGWLDASINMLLGSPVDSVPMKLLMLELSSTNRIDEEDIVRVGCAPVPSVTCPETVSVGLSHGVELVMG